MRILIAEDDRVSCRILSATLSKWGHEVVTTGNGLEAWAALQGDAAPPLAILDWMMPEMDGLEVCRRVRRAKTADPTYLILLTARSNKADMVEAFEAGADDYLTKPFDRNELRARLQVGARIIHLQRSLAERVRELETAVEERKRVEEELREMSLTDELTGLYNRRGFFTLAEHFLKTARRKSQDSLMVYADMDGLKLINDTFGHDEGSRAISKAAEILRRTFRDSDIIARIGGDEFVALAEGAADGGDHVSGRLQQNLREYNERAAHAYQLSLSLGAVRVDAVADSAIEELVARADEEMYRHKRSKRLSAVVSESLGGHGPARDERRQGSGRGAR